MNDETHAGRYAHLIRWVPWDGGELPVAAQHLLPPGTLVDATYGCDSHLTSNAGFHADGAMFVRVLAFSDGSEPAR